MVKHYERRERELTIEEKIYLEIESGLERIKKTDVENILTGEDRNLDNIVYNVEEAINECETGKRLFHSWIFEGEIPEDLMDIVDEDDGDDGKEEEEEESNEESSDETEEV